MKSRESELSLISNIFLIATSIVTYNTIKNYSICKDFNNNHELTLVTPEIIKSKFSNKDIKRIQSLKLGKEILNFKKVMALNFDSEYLSILYNNLKSIKATESVILLKNLLLIPVGGYYKARKNKINVLKRLKKSVIDHELFHMATTIYNKKQNKAFVGFHQIDYKTKQDVGRGLNEGYTEVLTNRYFNTNNFSAHSYRVSKLFAGLLELIVGKEFMEKAYLKADLPSLITELEKYDTKENIMKFIYAWDYYIKYDMYKDSLLLFLPVKRKLRKNINECIRTIQESLIKWYSIKEKDEEKKELYSKVALHSILIKKYKKEY